jgi:uncharacterized protein (TIGR00251 family)
MPNSNNEKFKISKFEDGIKISVRIIPNSSKCEIKDIIDDSLRIKVDAPPVDGKANEKCIKFLAKSLNIPKSSIAITSGEKSKNKILYIKGNPDELIFKIYNYIH